MDAAYLINIGKQKFFQFFQFALFKQAVQTGFQCLTIQIFQNSSISFCPAGIQFQPFPAIETGKFFFNLRKGFYMCFGSDICRNLAQTVLVSIFSLLIKSRKELAKSGYISFASNVSYTEDS